MARVIVEVMPKPEILDPQGSAIVGALPRLGVEGVASVRQGKRFELVIDGEVDAARLEQLRRVAAGLLCNAVIEDFVIWVDDGGRG